MLGVGRHAWMLRCLVALTVVLSASAAAVAQARIPTIKPFTLGLYKVTLGLTGQASEQASGLKCSSASPVCSEQDNATYHVDLTYPLLEFVIAGTSPTKLPDGASDSKHVVNGSFHQSGSWFAPLASTASPYSCNGTLSAITPDAFGSHQITWKRHGSGYSFAAETETYGFMGDGSGNGPVCGSGTWFGQGRLEYKNEMTAFFTISKSELGQRSFTKTIGGPDARYREPSTCQEDRQSGTCTFTVGWHAVVKFKRTKEIKVP